MLSHVIVVGIAFTLLFIALVVSVFRAAFAARSGTTIEWQMARGAAYETERHLWETKRELARVQRAYPVGNDNWHMPREEDAIITFTSLASVPVGQSAWGGK